MDNRYGRLKWACYTTNVAQAIVCNLSPVLFITFHHLYDVSYSLLGLLTLVGFCTQLAVDLIFSFFSHRFNIPLSVKLTPFLTVLGLLVYALCPFLFPRHVYLCLVVGTVIFASSGGLAEVLISPTIAAIPAENPDREMSKLHSVYAWGVVIIISFATLFLFLFGEENWQFLTLFLALIPLLSFFLFLGSDIPTMQTPEKMSGALAMLKNPGLLLCVAAIFLGGAAECTMSQWCSGYLEQAMGIPKVFGDIFGLALFGLALGVGRTLYARIGKNISRVLFLGAVGAVVCYLTAALSPWPVLSLIACAFTGFCTSMLWPGSLIVASDRFPTGGVFIYAMMAAGGDCGASVGPQIIGLVTDAVAASPVGSRIAANLSLTAEQLGMKTGMLIGALFPFLAVFVYLIIWRAQRKKETSVKI